MIVPIQSMENVMTKNAINTKSEALELHALSFGELDAVSGGDKSNDAARDQAVQNMQRQQENSHQASAMKLYQQLLMHID